MKANNWDDPPASHVAMVIQRLFHVNNWTMKVFTLTTHEVTNAGEHVT